MKKILIFSIIIYMMIPKEICLADMSEIKSLIVPEKMKSIATPSGLLIYLDNSDEKLREAAVIRLGEIGGGESIRLLVETFNKEPNKIGMETPEGIKETVIISLGRIKSEESKKELLLILRNYIKLGPKYKGRYSHIYDSQYYRIIRMTIESLSNWDNDEVSNVYLEILNDNKLFYGIRQLSYTNYLKIDMRKRGIITVKEKCKYLSGALTDGAEGAVVWIKGKPGVKTMDAIKNGAIEDLFYWEHEKKDVLLCLDNILEDLPKDDSKRKKIINKIIERIKQKNK